MHFPNVISILTLVSFVKCHVEVRRGGWLNRVVQYHKEKFLQDFKQLAPIKINATILPAPEGYHDSDKWNFKSVLHLLVLIKESDPASPVRRAVRRMMAPTRRIMMNKEDSFKYFPSLGKRIVNNIYYDFESEEKKITTSEYSDEIDTQQEPVQPVDNGVIFISNPVEAKLPSAAISLKLLQDILMKRAIAARKMPTSTTKTIIWVPKNITEGEEEDDQKAEASGDGADETTEVVTEDEQETEDNGGEDQTTPTGSAELGDVGSNDKGGEQGTAPSVDKDKGGDEHANSDGDKKDVKEGDNDGGTKGSKENAEGDINDNDNKGENDANKNIEENNAAK